jgi:CheY-like chemotaxis protein
MPKTILIVEDYEDSRKFVKLLVESLGYRVAEAESAVEAIKIVINDKPDLILMDLAMPDVDGLAATKVIRGLTGKDLPIIAVSGYDIDDELALDAGCNELICKPLSEAFLERLLTKYLNDKSTIN